MPASSARANVASELGQTTSSTAFGSDQAEPPSLCLRVPIPALPNLDLEGLAVGANRLVQHLVVEPAPRQRSNQFNLALLDCVHVEIAQLSKLQPRQPAPGTGCTSGLIRTIGP